MEDKDRLLIGIDKRILKGIAIMLDIDPADLTYEDVEQILLGAIDDSYRRNLNKAHDLQDVLSGIRVKYEPDDSKTE